MKPVQDLKGFASKPTITKTNFPRLPYAVLRLFQLLCACLVLAINSFFMYHLYKNSYSIPWEFTLLDIVAVFSLINIAVSLLCICCTRQSALGIMITDGLLMLFWAIAYGIFAHSLGSTVLHSCNAGNWGDSNGVRVCNLFKTLFAFSLLAIFAYAATFTMAVAVRKREATHVYAPAVNDHEPAQYERTAPYDPLASRHTLMMTASTDMGNPHLHDTPGTENATGDIAMQQYGGFDRAHTETAYGGAHPAPAVSRSDSRASDSRSSVSGSVYSQPTMYSGQDAAQPYRDDPAHAAPAHPAYAPYSHGNVYAPQR